MGKTQVLGFRVPLSQRRYLGISLSSFVLVFIAWSIASYGGFVDEFFLPTPTKIATTFWQLLTEYHLLTDIWASLYRIIVAFVLSAVLAIPLGILMSCYKPIEAFAEPPIDFIRYLPVPALVPLCILWVGIGEGSKILLLFIGTFFQLVLLVMDDANNVPREYMEIAATLGAKTRDVVMRVLAPAMLPQVYEDLRITLGWCWTYLIIGEIVAARTGLGHMIREAQRFAKPDVVIVGIIIIGIIGLATDYAFKFGHRLLFKHRRA